MKLTSPDLLPAILTRLNLRDLAEEAGAHFINSNPNSSSNCPLHGGDNPTAFHIYANGTRWHCFTRCPDGKNDGDLVSFYMLWKNLDFRTALRHLAHRAGIPITPSPQKSSSTRSDHQFLSPRERKTEQSSVGEGSIHQPTPPSPIWQARAQSCIDYAHDKLLNLKIGAPVRAYLHSERGLTPETQEAFQLGFIPSDLFDNPLTWGIHPLPPPLLPGELANPLKQSDRRINNRPIPSSHPKRPTPPKNIYIPRGILIPGYHSTTPWYLKIRRPIPGDLLTEYIPPITSKYRPLPPNRPQNPDFPIPQSIECATINGRSVTVHRSFHPHHPSPALENGAPCHSPSANGRSFPVRTKFLSVRGSKPTLFGRHLWLGHSTLLLVEGEFDCMLAWQFVSHLCDVATLGSASNRASLPDLADLTRYQRILAVYDSDPAGDRARAYLSALNSSPLVSSQPNHSSLSESLGRIKLIPSPAHDLTDYFRPGHNLRKWLESILFS